KDDAEHEDEHAADEEADIPGEALAAQVARVVLAASLGTGTPPRHQRSDGHAACTGCEKSRARTGITGVEAPRPGLERRPSHRGDRTGTRCENGGPRGSGDRDESAERERHEAAHHCSGEVGGTGMWSDGEVKDRRRTHTESGPEDPGEQRR